MTSSASLPSPSDPPCPSSTIATDGELICSVLLNLLTLPENIASVPGRSVFDQWYWLKNVQVSCLLLSPMTTLVMCLTPRPLPAVAGPGEPQVPFGDLDDPGPHRRPLPHHQRGQVGELAALVVLARVVAQQVADGAQVELLHQSWRPTRSPGQSSADCSGRSRPLHPSVTAPSLLPDRLCPPVRSTTGTIFAAGTDSAAPTRGWAPLVHAAGAHSARPGPSVAAGDRQVERRAVRVHLPDDLAGRSVCRWNRAAATVPPGQTTTSLTSPARSSDSDADLGRRPDPS